MSHLPRRTRQNGLSWVHALAFSSCLGCAAKPTEAPRSAEGSSPSPTVEREGERAAKPLAPGAIVREGLAFWVRPRWVELSDGWGLEIEVEVRRVEGPGRRIFGRGGGFGLAGVRFGNMNGMQHLQESAELAALGRLEGDAPLVMRRSFPGRGGWAALRPGDGVILSLETWVVAEGSGGEPQSLAIAGVAASIGVDGTPTVEVQTPEH